MLLLALVGADGASVATDAAEPRDLATTGPHVVQAREVVVERSDQDGGDFEARLFVPLPRAGEGRRTVSPVVAFGHGFLTSVDRYEATLRHLASWGITTIAPRSHGGPLPDHAAFASDLAAAAEWVVSAARADGWPGLPVDGAARAVSGHSMGGGAAVLAAAADAGIATVATLAAADTRPSSIAAAAELRVPALFVAGSADTITPVDQHQRPMFAATTDVPAQLRVIAGGSHCGFLDEAVLVGLVCDEAGIDGDEQLALTREALVAWLRAELLGDDAATALAWPEADTGATTVESRDPRSGDRGGFAGAETGLSRRGRIPPFG